MVIVNQDRSEIVNFDEIFRLYVDNWSDEDFPMEPTCFCIKAEKASDNMIYAFLGEYKTKEREKEVLQEIIKAYLDCNEQNVLAEYAYVKNIVFEMPIE